MNTLYYVLDPMCSWCYAFEPTFKNVVKNLPSNTKVTYIHGGLAPHSNEPMPQSMQTMLQGIWKQIEQQVGIKFNHDFWTKCKPRRSTYLACQACIAARKQNKEYEMIKAIQDLYYQKASNPSDTNTLITAAKNINLDIVQFKEDLESEEIIDIFHNDLTKRKNLQVYSFPSLVLEYNDQYFPINIEYNNYKFIINQIKDIL